MANYKRPRINLQMLYNLNEKTNDIISVNNNNNKKKENDKTATNDNYRVVGS